MIENPKVQYCLSLTAVVMVFWGLQFVRRVHHWSNLNNGVHTTRYRNWNWKKVMLRVSAWLFLCVGIVWVIEGLVGRFHGTVCVAFSEGYV